MPTDRPTVSVVMATYNGEKYLREQIDSILAQTYPIHELIIEDDRSTDGTVEIAKEYAANHDNVFFFENGHTLGVNLNFKAAAMRATGDLVAISDQDDVWFPDKIGKQVERIGDYDICYTDLLRGTDKATAHVVTYKHGFAANLFFGIAGHTTLMRRDFIQDEKNWMEDFWYDWGLELHAQLGRGITHLPEALNWHRDYPASVTRSQHDRYFQDKARHRPWTPYVEGYRNYRRLQEKLRFRRVYQQLYELTENSWCQLEHELCGLLLRRDVVSLMRLSLLCMRFRDDIYPRDNTRGFMGRVRGFFYPFIWAYHNTLFDD